MTQKTIARIVWTTTVTGMIVGGAAVVLAALHLNGHTRGPLVTAAANVVMVLTLAVQATYLVVQLFPNGRTFVPVFTPTGDGWLFAIMTTGWGGVVWDDLGALAGPPMSHILPSPVSPLFNCLLLLIGRMVQLRRIRPPATQVRQDQPGGSA
jgi:hypothetical protein